MAESRLKKYNTKRNFDVTSEPKGREARSDGKKLRFSVQHHSARADHYDLRLEFNGVALSWAVPKGPSYCAADKRLAMRVEDHPVDYMDFEGVIPKGEYGGGTVMLWDEGVWIPRTDPGKGLEEGSLKFFLDGRRLKGDWALVRMKGGKNSEPWLLIKERDGYAKNTAGISRFTRGVRSGKSMAEIAERGAENPFDKAEAMLAAPCEKLPAGKDWIYELKYDGHRVLSFSGKGKTALYSRNGYACTSVFSAAADALSETLKGRAAVVDGEMVVAGEDGVPDFGALQAYVKNRKKGALCYVVFDLLALDGEDLRGLPLIERKRKLKALLKDAPETISYSEHTEKMDKSRLQAIKSKEIEGVVAKNKNSAYSPGRNGDWQKLKFRNEREFAIGGYALSDGGSLRSLLLGYFGDGKLKFAGRVGTGFTEDDRRELLKELSGLSRKTSPFYDLPEEYKKGAKFVKPTLAAQVRFAEVTSSGVLRQASFKGIRRDKTAEEADEILKPVGDKKTVYAKKEKSNGAAKKRAVKKGASETDGETEKVAGITVTHPDKKVFSDPVITKAELCEYYSAVSGRMLPHIKDRFLSLVCCPSGISGEKFFLRHFEREFPGIKRAAAEDGEYFFITGEKALVYLAQYNAVEFHTWASRKSSPYRPDIMVFDLDPDEGLPLGKVRQGVKDLKEVLDGLGLESFLKTSGGKGYHIVVPFKTGADGQLFRDFARRVAEILESAYPKRYTSSISKKSREGKIFIDWQRNSPGATSAAPYSVRAREGAYVSMPVSYDELSETAPDSVDLRAALRRLDKPDPWENFFKVKAAQSLLKIK